MKPADFLRMTNAYLDEMTKAKRTVVKVGLPLEKVGSKIYGPGLTIITVGAWHEYGFGNNPVRSFLRVPFAKNAKNINEFIAKQFNDVCFKGVTADKALNLVGVYTSNISKDAFKTSGEGEWAANAPSTIKAKGSSKPLIDTGTLRNSITWQVSGV